MAVQQNKKSPSKRGMHRAHDFAAEPAARGGARHRRGASAPPHQPQRLLPRQEGRQDQGRRVGRPAGRVGDRGRPPGRTAGRRPGGSLRMPVTVAVDAMGGDHGPSVTLAAALEFLEETPDARVIAVGLEAPLRAALAKLRSPAPRSADDPRGERSRRDARAAGRRAAQEEGLVDARRDQPRQGRGRAGLRFGGQHRRADGDLALRAEDAARHRPAGDRRAAADARRASSTVLDLGANVNCSPEQLVQFAVMGTALVAAMDGIERPTVGLLNVGEEEIKGNELAKRTGELLRRPASISTATSKATTSTRARPTSSSATASSATSR